MEIKEIRELYTRVLDNIRTVMIGSEEVFSLVFSAMLSGGHVLLEDMPGTGKTTMAKCIADSIDSAFKRVQFTPDLMPQDITGLNIYSQKSEEFEFIPGPVFTNILLADEINRATPRTQAALLEAMEEHQVTVDGITHQLPDPFIVIATENQVGAAGTQMLPHAQMDRFLVRLTIGYPDKESEMRIIQGRQTEDPYADIKKVADLSLVKAMQRATLMVTIKEPLVGYITDLVEASRSSQFTELGISPRGSIAVSHMAKASALMHGRDYVIEEDIRDVFCDVCSHRVILTQKARAAGMTPRNLLEQILESVLPPYNV